MKTVLSAVLVLCSTVGVFADGVLPLDKGVYVDAAVKCEDAGNVDSMIYAGETFHSSQMFETMKVLGHKGDVYQIRISLKDIIVNKLIGTFHWTAVIPDNKTVTLTTQYSTTTYRWCDIKMAL